MATLPEIARDSTDLTRAQTAHLQRLVASWNLLADFCFSDLLLFVPVKGEDDGFVVGGHVRPSTSQTLYRQDLIGHRTTEAERPLVTRSMKLGEIIEGEITLEAVRERVRILCIPVRWAGQIIAILSRESTPSVGRQPGELERTYVSIFNRFARMIAAGQFPFAVEDSVAKEVVAPRVGDGVVVLDRARCVEYASPNAVSALHQVGVHANPMDRRLGEIGLEEEMVRDAFAMATPVTRELERADTTVLVRCIPMLDGQGVSGAVVLFRDITEVRRRDRLLLSKDATIREIHHRVKNNLQTISSLLRLQGRRTDSPEARYAIEESVRRISSIALVHETLSREAGEDVPFVEILRPLVRMVEEAVSSPERNLRFEVVGEVGTLQPAIVTPMAVVLTELLQNAVDHAYPEGMDVDAAGHKVRVELAEAEGELTVRVIDDGVGLPDEFSVDKVSGLGLSIVRALVTSDLNGTIDMFAPPDGSPGTIVELRLPTRP